jgi:hypothetical protein
VETWQANGAIVSDVLEWKPSSLVRAVVIDLAKLFEEPSAK